MSAKGLVGNDDDPPLPEEIDLILGHWSRPVVMVDDFQVPDDSGYGHIVDSRGRPFSLGYVDPGGRLGLSAFYPASPSSEETAQKQGWAILAIDHGTLERLREISALRERP